MENYRVECMMFGQYPRGAVLPKSIADKDGRIANFIADGTLSRTSDPVTIDPLSPDVPDRMAAENFRQLKDSQEEIAELRLSLQNHAERVLTLKAENEGMAKNLAVTTGENGRLSAINTSKELQIDKLKEENKALKERTADNDTLQQELGRTRQELQKHKTEAEEAKQKVAESTEALKALESEVERLKLEITEEKEHSAELEQTLEASAPQAEKPTKKKKGS